MKAKIEIKMDNAAFENGAGAELARILRGITNTLHDRAVVEMEIPLRDSNGNTVGKFEVLP